MILNCMSLMRRVIVHLKRLLSNLEPESIIEQTILLIAMSFTLCQVYKKSKQSSNRK